MNIIVSPWSPVIEDRVTAPDGPGDEREYAAAAYAFHLLGYGDQWRERVTPHTALTYSAFWACVRIISQTLAGIGWHVFERQERGARKLPINDNIAWTLDMQANPEMAAFEWRQVMLKDALVWGNGYSEIERNNGGKILWLWRLDPSRVSPERDDSGSLYYRVSNGPGVPDSFVSPANMFHLRGLGPDGVVGYSVVEMARRSIELGLQEERFGSEFFRRGPMPGGVLNVPGQLQEPALKTLRDSFQNVYGGMRNAGRVAVMSGGMTFTPLSLPNKDAEFLEARTFQVSEICRWFGVPPHKLADLSRATFSNIEEQERAFVADCLLPWARRLESEADIKLYGSVSMGRRYTRLNLDSLQRGNSQTQTDTVTKKVTGGLMTPNEGREFFDLNPDPSGDVLMVQGQMLPLERAIAEPADMGQPGAGGVPNGTPEGIAALLRACGGEGSGVPGPCPGGGKDDKEDDTQEQHDNEDVAVEEQRGSEDVAVEEQRDAEDTAIQEQRDGEDKAAEERDAAVEEQRGAEDTAVEQEEAAIQEERDREDAAIEEQREKEDEERPDKDNAAAREREDTAREQRREREDAAREKRREKEADRRAREDAQREKETAHRERQREREDAAREKKRQKEDADRARRRKEEDAARERRRKEDTHRKASALAPAAELRRPILALLEDAYGRLLRVEADKARRANNRGELGRHTAGYYTPDGKRHVAETIRPILAALLIAAGDKRDVAGNYAADLAEDHSRRSVKDLSSGAWAETWGNGRAAEQAKAHLDLIWEALTNDRSQVRA